MLFIISILMNRKNSNNAQGLDNDNSDQVNSFKRMLIAGKDSFVLPGHYPFTIFIGNNEGIS